MTTKEFRKRIKALGLDVRKRKGLEVLDIIDDGTEICSVTYAELYDVLEANDILSEKLRPEYVHPLG
jgi:hypothetical protein